MTTDATIARHGLLFILSSPSGAGKSTLARRLLAGDGNITFSVSATTRPMRPGEVDGREYHFRTVEQFRALVDGGEMLEHAEVFGNYYGTPAAPVQAAVEGGRDVLFDVDWQGGQQIRASALAHLAVSVFILPPSIATLDARLRGRGQDAEDVIAGRMARAMGEIVHWDAYDYILINDDIDKCAAQLTAILTAERLKRARRPGLSGFVDGLRREHEGGS